MIRDLIPPLGYSLQDLRSAAIVARYHRGALPRAGQKALLGLSLKQRQEIAKLAAILRLANAFDSERDQRVQRLQVVDSEQKNKVLTIAAQGYSPRDNQAEAIAAARHLLETVHRRPVLIKVLKPKPRLQKPETRNRKPAARS
jgi:exopolyphosphatase/guanosine-5'-triphosphate,3'-diphosphate pyrophosphatase